MFWDIKNRHMDKSQLQSKYTYYGKRNEADAVIMAMYYQNRPTFRKEYDKLLLNGRKRNFNTALTKEESEIGIIGGRGGMGYNPPIGTESQLGQHLIEGFMIYGIKSPLERNLFVELELMRLGLRRFYDKDFLICPQVAYILDDHLYEVDFLLATVPDDHGWRKIIIEVDSAEWHYEKQTKEGWTAERKRDRVFAKYGYLVLRYCNGEIYNHEKRLDSMLSMLKYLDLTKVVKRK